MKIDRETRRDARKLFLACLVNGRVDEGRVRAAVREVAEKKPRRFLGILSRLQKLIEIEVEKRTFSVESAVELPDRGAAIFKDLEARFGPPLSTSYEVVPALLGGVRLQVGSHVWDGSVKERLHSLQSSN